MVTILQSLDIDVLWLIKVIITAFTAIVFLQSGFDKVMDWDGNNTYLKAHFAKTPFANWVHFLMPSITFLEVVTGICSFFGFIMLFTGTDTTAFVALFLANITMLALLLGQRIAKDYDGASKLMPYFLVLIFGLFIYLK